MRDHEPLADDFLRSPLPFSTAFEERTNVDGKVLVIDDEPATLQVVKRILTCGGIHDVATTTESVNAIQLIKHEKPDVVLLDIMMPQVSGLDILETMQAEPTLRNIQVVVFTASSDIETKLAAVERGAADFLSKPVDRAELLARIRNLLLVKHYLNYLEDYSAELEWHVTRRTIELARSREEAIRCLARASEFRDDQTGRHVIRVGLYSQAIASQLGWEGHDLQMIRLAAELHDIGKIGIPDAILLKPGRLSEEEFDTMREHCEIGERIVGPGSEAHVTIGEMLLGEVESPILSMARRIAASHHEKWDGSGYPKGLAGDKIPLEGRIVAVADVFDALSSSRPYKEAFPLAKCFEILSAGREQHFDPMCLDAFFDAKEEVLKIWAQHADPIHVDKDGCLTSSGL